MLRAQASKIVFTQPGPIADIGISPFSDFALARRAASRGGLFAVLADEDVGGAVDVEVADHECRKGSPATAAGQVGGVSEVAELCHLKFRRASPMIE